MRKCLLFAALLAGCSKGEAPADTTAMRPSAPAPAALTAAMMTDSWSGVSMPEGQDSVVGRWTAVSTSDSTGRLEMQGSKNPIPFRKSFAGDSMVVVSEPYVSPANPKGPPVAFRSVARLNEDTLAGTISVHVASKPDSVVSRLRWTATRAPRS